MSNLISKVYFLPIGDTEISDEAISALAGNLLKEFIQREGIQLPQEMPIKVHFGERGNSTYIKSACYNGIIDVLKKNNVSTCFAETSVLYGGSRFSKEKHIKLACDHNFTQLPICIADGSRGEDAIDVPSSGKYFKSCSIAKALAEAPGVLVASHFKGHALAGFGGAIKQLSMGFASKGGKLAMHMGVKPQIFSPLCKACQKCVVRCNENAIEKKGKKFKINHDKCVGCGACFSICPSYAVWIFSLSGFVNMLLKKSTFKEKLGEYAAAAVKGKANIYMNFALNITSGCDCEPRPMRKCCKNIGIFISKDPVAIDKACWDLVAQHGKKFKGMEQLQYASSLGAGNMEYNLLQINNI
jgi:uncharacterized Fe-S center protein